jgi:hypothetical protein
LVIGFFDTLSAAIPNKLYGNEASIVVAFVGVEANNAL